MNQKSRIFLTLLNITGVLSSFGGLVIATLISTESLPDTSWILLRGSYFDLNKSATRMGFFLIFVSFSLLIITTIGCLGSLCNFRALLVVYGILLMVLIVFQVSGLLLLFTHDAKNKRFLEYFLEQVFNDYKEQGLNRDLSSVFTEAMFPVFSCCGVNNITDFNTTITKWKPNLENRPVNFSGFLVPKECCRNPKDNSSLRECLLQPTDQNAYTEGCFLVINKVLGAYSDAFALIAILIVSFQVFVLILAAVQCTQDNTELIYEQTDITVRPKPVHHDEPHAKHRLIRPSLEKPQVVRSRRFGLAFTLSASKQKFKRGLKKK